MFKILNDYWMYIECWFEKLLIVGNLYVRILVGFFDEVYIYF